MTSVVEQGLELDAVARGIASLRAKKFSGIERSEDCTVLLMVPLPTDRCDEPPGKPAGESVADFVQAVTEGALLRDLVGAQSAWVDLVHPDVLNLPTNTTVGESCLCLMLRVDQLLLDMPDAMADEAWTLREAAARQMRVWMFG